MSRSWTSLTVGLALLAGLALLLTFTTAEVAAQSQSHTSTPFMGPKANKGTVTHSKQGGQNVLTLSDDFVVPDTPDPHWRVVDSRGRIYDLHKLRIKENGYNQSITVPAYVPDVAKVIIWCAWAEANLGEASFSAPVK